ncbi:hypothetical protein L1887_53627 [Cichorium endivia]|nr:hypothetical protein L1887_53627 [Cichorium endivia]
MLAYILLSPETEGAAEREAKDQVLFAQGWLSLQCWPPTLVAAAAHLDRAQGAADRRQNSVGDRQNHKADQSLTTALADFKFRAESLCIPTFFTRALESHLSHRAVHPSLLLHHHHYHRLPRARTSQSSQTIERLGNRRARTSTQRTHPKGRSSNTAAMPSVHVNHRMHQYTLIPRVLYLRRWGMKRWSCVSQAILDGAGNGGHRRCQLLHPDPDALFRDPRHSWDICVFELLALLLRPYPENGLEGHRVLLENLSIVVRDCRRGGALVLRRQGPVGLGRTLSIKCHRKDRRRVWEGERRRRLLVLSGVEEWQPCRSLWGEPARGLPPLESLPVDHRVRPLVRARGKPHTRHPRNSLPCSMMRALYRMTEGRL